MLSGQKLYLVEVIVFNNLGPIPPGGEIWHREPRIEFDPEKFAAPPVSSIPQSKPIVSSVESPANEAPVEADPIQFTELDHLAPHRSSLHTDPRYEVVTYAAWVQPLFDKGDAVPVPVMREPAPTETTYSLYPPPEVPLSGNVRIYEQRLLFVDIDVTSEFFDEFSGYSSSNRQDRPPGKYSIREKRRVKLNELHYFDHPFFGLLFRVSRYEPEAPGADG
jgi:hypothetical protein